MTNAPPRPDEDAREAAAQRQATLTKPAGALGRLEELSIWAAGVQGTCPPHEFRDVRVLLVAGDHGVAKSGVSAYPPEVTAQMVLNFLSGGAGVSVLARMAGARVIVLDLAVDSDLAHDFPSEVTAYKVRRGSGSIDIEDALSDDELEAAIAAGEAIANKAIDEGADLLIVGDMGIGNTTPAAALIAALTAVEPVAAVGRGTGIDDQAWMRKAEAVRDALHRAGLESEPLSLLRKLGGADFAAITSILMTAARRRTPVILDGIVSCVCAVLAMRLAPGSERWWVAGHRSTEPAQALALRELALTPLLDLGLRLGEGTGALLALPIVQAGIATLAEMATFDEAGVSDRDV